MSGDFGLREALGEDDYRKLIQRQLEVAERYMQVDVIVRNFHFPRHIRIFLLRVLHPVHPRRNRPLARRKLNDPS